MKKAYLTLPEIECLSGDTLPPLEIAVSGIDTGGCRMEMILSKKYSDTASAVLIKPCTPAENGFTMQLTSADTQTLTEGTYSVHFRLVDSGGLSYRKAAGVLHVRAVPKGGS